MGFGLCNEECIFRENRSFGKSDNSLTIMLSMLSINVMFSISKCDCLIFVTLVSKTKSQIYN